MRTNFATASSDIILQSARVYPFGEELSPATANDRDKFATYHRDNSTGLDYAMNRYYGSTLGRFTTADPFGGSARLGNPASWNRYAYSWNDPINNNDRDGLLPAMVFIDGSLAPWISPGAEQGGSSFGQWFLTFLFPPAE
ncbi:MAG: RHS repeat-associated core domain-containing protein [Acidobacteriota bacterium]